MKKRTWFLTLLSTVLLLTMGGILLWRTGFFQAATSLSGLQDYLTAFSPYSHLVFFLLQLASVIIAPIPSNVTALAGALLFGALSAFLLTWAAVVLGSFVVFLLARRLGQAFVDRFVSQTLSDRYLEVIHRKRDVFLAMAFLFPFFPDDILCILAGLTEISLPRFLVLVILFRPWGLLVASAVGGSVVSIPLWGMVLLGLGGLSIFLLGMKYGDRLEEALLHRFGHKK
ncbi:TVP38/TMEM64 family protein [Intestinimonas butyriciproducens]|uniref:TVP38/TMEM64 family protein n=1 Tax=Intestinimonas butyriciproducens TaxID=1297617 RepID=UPI00195AB8E6|nr:VTT domain-containing protein [Intestinimonas butyriciproducens]MBM6976692.1 TVP38/TMEM64 family protein [Intestinimonas butyriciproducens]